MRLAAERGDVDNVIKLFDRYERLVNNKQNANPNIYVYYGGYYTLSSTPADSFCRTMLARADAKAPGDIARLLDHYLVAARRPDRMTRRVRSIASTSAVSRRNQFQVWTGKTAKFTTVSYPNPNPYYDLASIQVLRNAYELYKRDDLVSDLQSHLKKSLEAGSDVDRTYIHLALCYLNWWNEDKDEALRELTEAAQASKSDPEILLSLAELRAQRNEPEEALRIADSFEPLDQKAMQRREVLAIRLAVVTGDVNRARKAAERLFGLRLDADTQVQLASQMHQLGMHELAEAVLGRARRRAGGNVAALVALMLQYQRQGKAEVAVQVAHQILRKNTARANPGYYDEGDEARSEAVQVLARSGKIKEMIGRPRPRSSGPLARPSSAPQPPGRLLQGGRRQGQGQARIRRHREAPSRRRQAPVPDRQRADPGRELRSRHRALQGCAQKGTRPARLELLRDPASVPASRQVRRPDPPDRGLRHPRDWPGLLSRADHPDRPPGQDQAKTEWMALFAKAWKAYPGQRDYLFMYINNEEVWQFPEMYDYIREAALPAQDRKSVPAWMGINDTLRSMGNGKVTTIGGRLVEIADRRGKLEALTEEIERAEKRLPNWRGGQALRGLILARRGRIDEARTLIAPLAEPKQADTAPALVRQVIGQEWEDVPALRPLALTLFESAMKEADTDDLIYYNSPVQRLIEMYRRAGRLGDARQELLASARKAGNYSYDPGVAAYYKILERTEIAAKLMEIGFPTDAARLYDETLADNESFDRAKDYFGDNESQQNLLRQGLEAALRALDPETLATTLQVQFSSPAPVNLLLLIQPREFERASVASLFDAAIKSAAVTPKALAELRSSLEKQVDGQPEDIPTRVALTLATFAAGSARVDAIGRGPDEAGPRIAARNPRSRRPGQLEATSRGRSPAWPLAGRP